jgi:microcystin-dependent protein
MASYAYTFQNGDVVTPAKLNAARTVSAIQTADISDSQITTAKIADANVTTAKIADSNVTTAKIADTNVTTAKIADGAVTNAKLGNDIILVPAGAIMPFAMATAPTGWLPADGTEYSKTGTYATLFAAIGTTHGETNGSGGVGTSHFRVPDLRGYFIRGFGTNSDGTASAAFGTKQADAFQGHYHQINRVAGGGSFYAFSEAGEGWSEATLILNNSYVRQPITDNTNGTPRTAAETRPRNIALLYCIKF